MAIILQSFFPPTHNVNTGNYDWFWLSPLRLISEPHQSTMNLPRINKQIKGSAVLSFPFKSSTEVSVWRPTICGGDRAITNFVLSVIWEHIQFTAGIQARTRTSIYTLLGEGREKPRRGMEKSVPHPNEQHGHKLSSPFLVPPATASNVSASI